MDSFTESIKRIVDAESIVQKKREIGRLSILFYTACREAGLEKEDIISLTTQILDCFITDLNYLKDKLDKGEKKRGRHKVKE